jgi:hypothetical protein
MVSKYSQSRMNWPTGDYPVKDQVPWGSDSRVCQSISQATNKAHTGSRIPGPKVIDTDPQVYVNPLKCVLATFRCNARPRHSPTHSHAGLWSDCVQDLLVHTQHPKIEWIAPQVRFHSTLQQGMQDSKWQLPDSHTGQGQLPNIA